MLLLPFVGLVSDPPLIMAFFFLLGGGGCSTLTSTPGKGLPTVPIFLSPFKGFAIAMTNYNTNKNQENNILVLFQATKSKM